MFVCVTVASIGASIGVVVTDVVVVRVAFGAANTGAFVAPVDVACGCRFSCSSYRY